MRFVFILLIQFTILVGSFAQQKSKSIKSLKVTTFPNTETEPHFKGGQSKWMQFVSENLRIDSSCNDAQDLSELMVIQFTISVRRRITGIEVIKSADCMKDALINLIKLSEGKWIPATRHGKYVKSYWKVPVRVHTEINRSEKFKLFFNIFTLSNLSFLH